MREKFVALKVCEHREQKWGASAGNAHQTVPNLAAAAAACTRQESNCKRARIGLNLKLPSRQSCACACSGAIAPHSTERATQLKKRARDMHCSEDSAGWPIKWPNSMQPSWRLAGCSKRQRLVNMTVLTHLASPLRHVESPSAQLQDRCALPFKSVQKMCLTPALCDSNNCIKALRAIGAACVRGSN